MTSGIVLGIGLCFNDHAQEQAAVVLAFHQPAADQIIVGNDLRWTAEKSVRQGREIVSDELGGYGRAGGDTRQILQMPKSTEEAHRLEKE